ncbi:MAG TPA: acyltransferase [Sediminibacterium sp.]
MKLSIIISKTWNRLKWVLYIFNGWRWRFFLASCGSDFVAPFNLSITGAENIAIGKDFNAMGPCYLLSNDGKLLIGDHFRTNTNVLIGASFGEIRIGDNVLIGPNTVLRAANHVTKKLKNINEQGNIGGRIVIDDDVWIGANVVILKDVHLGKGCVIGAGAVVTKDVEPYSIVAGIPAKKISMRD